MCRFWKLFQSLQADAGELSKGNCCMHSGLKSKSSSCRLHSSSGAENMTEEAFKRLSVSLSKDGFNLFLSSQTAEQIHLCVEEPNSQIKATNHEEKAYSFKFIEDQM